VPRHPAWVANRREPSPGSCCPFVNLDDNLLWVSIMPSQLAIQLPTPHKVLSSIHERYPISLRLPLKVHTNGRGDIFPDGYYDIHYTRVFDQITVFLLLVRLRFTGLSTSGYRAPVVHSLLMPLPWAVLKGVPEFVRARHLTPVISASAGHSAMCMVTVRPFRSKIWIYMFSNHATFVRSATRNTCCIL
jgi:hypothetical protein